MIRLGLRCSVVAIGLVFGTATWLVSFLEAQAPLQPAAGEEAMLSRLEDKLKGPENNRLSDLRYGKKPVLDASPKETEENREVLKKAARHYVYRLTNPIYLEKEKNPEGLTMNGLVQEATDKLLVPEIKKKQFKPDTQGEYLKNFAKEVHACLRDVLSKNSKPIVRVNATRILSGLAEAGQEEVADSLLALLKNPNESDAVKLYACRGLKELFELGTAGKSAFQDPKREAACIVALNEFLARPRPKTLPAEAPADEVAAYQYVRREAIRALALSRSPLVANVKGPEGLTALWLQHAVKKQLDPETSLSEQADASIGLCRLQASLNKSYNLDQAAFQVGTFLLEFIKSYNDQRVSKNTTLPWKLYTIRTVLALEELDSQAKGTPSAAYVSGLVAVAKKVLREIEVDKESANPDELDKFLRGNQPTNKDLLKGVSEATLKTGAP